jgi:tRNA threonylcarbamoyladenosine biosynthesis protein TsaB
MPSFRQVAAANAPLLALDAASSRIQVGLIDADCTARWENVDAEAGTGVFACIDELGVNLETINGFLFCEGPGSILGIRTVAAAIRAWNVLKKRPVWSYKSLELSAAFLGDPEALVISDARRESWNVSQLGHPCLRIPSDQLKGRKHLHTPEGFRQWSKVPDETELKTLPYTLPLLFSKAMDAELLHATEEPEAFQHEQPSYAIWTPQIHRAPV